MVPKYFLALLLGHHFSLRIVLSKLEKLQLFFMPSLHPTQQLNHVFPKQKIVSFWPNNKRFFSLHTTLFHQSTAKLDSQRNLLGLVLPKPMPQFNEKFGTHYFSKITTINLIHGNCCNNFISHGNSPPYNLVNNLLIASNEHCNMLKTQRNKTQ